MIRTQIYLPEDLHRELMLLPKIRKVNYSTLIREGVAHVVKSRLKKKRKSGKGFVGALTYGPTDLSTRINDIYK